MASLATVPAGAETAHELDTAELRINFQPGNKEIPAGFDIDAGHSYDAARGWGWIAEDGLDRQCVDRHSSPDQELDTHCHATTRYEDRSGTWTAIDSPANWRADLPDGRYTITVTVGDSKKRTPSIAHSVQVEGVTFHDREPTTEAQPWARVTRDVTIEGGLDLHFDGGHKTKLISVVAVRLPELPISSAPSIEPVDAHEIAREPDNTHDGANPYDEAPRIPGQDEMEPAAVNPVDIPDAGIPDDVAQGSYAIPEFDEHRQLAVNFQTAHHAVPDGYVADSGRPYTAWRGYGWELTDSHRRQCGDRNNTGDQLAETFCHATTTYRLEAGRWVPSVSPASWRARVPNGVYRVQVTVGETKHHYVGIRHSVQAEGSPIHQRVQTTDARPLVTAGTVVTVSDRMLDITFDGGRNTKIVALTITPIGAQFEQPHDPSTPSGPSRTPAPPVVPDTPGPDAPDTPGPDTPEDPEAPQPDPAPTSPEIDVWQGNARIVGAAGVPQRFVNITGSVSDANGTVVELTARINGQAQRIMRLGPTDRRLARPGDFNVDIPVDQLNNGPNKVVLEATDDDGLTSTTTVIVDFRPGHPTADVSIDWSDVGDIDEVGLVVDGDWQITGNGVRTLDPGYDRLLAVGDVQWKDYEILTSFTLHGINPDHLERPSNGAGIGILAHWTGHSANPADDDPLIGFKPDAQGNVSFGALMWVNWRSDGSILARVLDHQVTEQARAQYRVNDGETHMIRAQVTGGDDPTYRWRVWRADKPEPTNWQFVMTEGPAPRPTTGSVALVAHEADVTFGDVTISPLG